MSPYSPRGWGRVGGKSNSCSSRLVVGACALLLAALLALPGRSEANALIKANGLQLTGGNYSAKVGLFGQYPYFSLRSSEICSVADGGDFNGDGHKDALLTFCGVTNRVEGYDSWNFGGVVCVAYGGRSVPEDGYVSLAGLKDDAVCFLNSQADQTTGLALAGGADFNKDGIDDIAVGIPEEKGGGEVYLIFGTKNPEALPKFKTDPYFYGNDLGWESDQLASFVDLDKLQIGKGKHAYYFYGESDDSAGQTLAFTPSGDLAISDPDNDNTRSACGNALGGDNDCGQVWVIKATSKAIGKEGKGSVYLRPTNEGAGAFQWGCRIDGPHPGARLGSSLHGGVGAFAGNSDVNGNGSSDIVIGASETNPSGSGAVFVIDGNACKSKKDVVVSKTLLTYAARGFRILGAKSGDHTGSAVAVLGDVNGDGMSDIAVGSSGDFGPYGGSQGRVDVVFGRLQLPNADQSLGALGKRGFRVYGPGAGSRLGSAVAPVGDFDSDGKADLIVGAPYADLEGKKDNGGAWLIHDVPKDGKIYLASLLGGYVKGDEDPGLFVQFAGSESGAKITGEYDYQSGWWHDALTGLAAVDLSGDGKRDILVAGRKVTFSKSEISAPPSNPNLDRGAGATFAVNAPNFSYAVKEARFVCGSARLGSVSSVAPKQVSGLGPFSFKIKQQSLPAGLKLDAGTGSIQGTPQETKPKTSYTVVMQDSKLGIEIEEKLNLETVGCVSSGSVRRPQRPTPSPVPDNASGGGGDSTKERSQGQRTQEDGSRNVSSGLLRPRRSSGSGRN